jgi:transcription termination factor 2
MKRMERHGRGGFLCDEMGLGKTITMATFLMQNRIRRLTDLIVCPLSLMKHWKRELIAVYTGAGKKAPRILFYHGPKRKEVLHDAKKPYHYIITTYSILGRRELNQKMNWGRVVLDESHYIRNGVQKKKTKCALGAYAVGRHSQFNWCITGTPFNNRLKDIASQCKFVGTAPYNNPEWWRRKRGGGDEGKRESWRNRFVLRRTKDHLLAPPIYHDVEVTANPDEADLFTVMRRQAERTWKKWKTSTGRRKQRLSGHILALIQRLRVASNSFLCGDSDFCGEEAYDECAKVKAIVDELNTQVHRSSEKSVVVFSQFTSFLRVLESAINEVLDGVEVYNFTGRMSLSERDEVVADFKEATHPRVLLISLLAGGCGLTLVPSSTVFLSEPYYNPFTEKQAEERVHRIGQTNQVNIYRFSMADSVETWIQGLKEKKMFLIKGLDLVHKKEEVKTFSFDDLSDLFKEVVSFDKGE